MTDNITLPRAVARLARDHIQWFIDNEEGGRFVEEREALSALDAALAEPEETFAESLFRRSWEAHRAALAEPAHIHTCPPDCQKPLCVNRRREIEAAVEAEREACAKIAEAWDADHTDTNYGLCIGNAIRARGSK
jgi:hypothetical protein